MKPTMTPAYRQYLLKEKGVTQKAIALELGVVEMCVSKEIHNLPHTACGARLRKKSACRWM